MEDSVSNQMGKLEEILVLLFRQEMAEEVRKVQQANSEMINALRNEKDKLFMMNNDLLLKIFDLQKRDLETFKEITHVQEEVRSERVRADLLQVRIINVEYSEIFEDYK